jgi:hypothetical protein
MDRTDSELDDQVYSLIEESSRLPMSEQARLSERIKALAHWCYEQDRLYNLALDNIALTHRRLFSPDELDRLTD